MLLLTVKRSIVSPFGQIFLLAAALCIFGYTFVSSKVTLESAVADARIEGSDRSRPGVDYGNAGWLRRKFGLAKQTSADRIPKSFALCPPFENLQLFGRLPMNVEQLAPYVTLSDIAGTFRDVDDGHWAPKDCLARHKVVFIITYRERLGHLTMWLVYMLPILQRQMLEFFIIIVEQLGTGLFNKGRLNNAAFTYAESLNASCVVFHDVDLLPEDDRLYYGCPDIPMHLGAYVDTLGYEVLYDNLVGGVLSMKFEHYRKVNGFSNAYWGWGGEDDDLALRILGSNMTLGRPNKLLGRFTMIKHQSRKEQEALKYRGDLIDDAVNRMHKEGLNTPVWILEKVAIEQLYHHLFVKVGHPPLTTTVEFTRTSYSPPVTIS